MGYGSWDSVTYNSMRSSNATKSAKDIFTSTKVTKDMDPINISLRESRDSVDHPLSKAVSFWLDVTGSMGDIPVYLVKEKLGTLIETMLAHGTADAQILFGAIGDHFSDRSPLQIGQFESETTLINKWLTSVHIEKGGGGTCQESYLLAWLVASRHFSLDCFEKRGEKGILFTCGDEMTHETISAEWQRKNLGYTQAADLTALELLEAVKRTHHVFHLHVQEGSNGKDEKVMEHWRNLLGQHVIMIEDKNTIPEVVASTVALLAGQDLAKVTSGFDSKTADKVSSALAKFDNTSTSVSTQETGIISF